MNQNKPSSRPLALGIMAVSAVVSVLIRLIPYGVRPPNVAANGSMGLFGGARVPLWIAVILQLFAMAVGDVLLWKIRGIPWSPTLVSIASYASFCVYLLLGRGLIGNSHSPQKFALASFLGSLQFFLITNFAVWYAGGIYEPNLGGLMQSYAAGLLFFGFTLAGDLGFTAVLFGAEAWLYGMLYGAKPVKVTEEVAS